MSHYCCKSHTHAANIKFQPNACSSCFKQYFPFLLPNPNPLLRAVVSNYRESADSCKNSNLFFFDQKIPLGKLFSKTIFKSSSKSPVWRKIEKFKIWLNLAERRVKIMQIRAFLKRSYKTRKTCFYLKFTGFVTHFLKLLSTYILSRSMLSFHSFHSRTEVSVSYFVDTVNFTGF